MIIDLDRFISDERPFWTELAQLLDRMDRDASFRLAAHEIKRFHYLYQRASSDLTRMLNFSADKHVRLYLENLVARAFAEIHETRRHRSRFDVSSWFFKGFPRAVRKHASAFVIALTIMAAGCAFGCLAVVLDPQSKETLMPFSHLMGNPSDRVAFEESATKDRLSGQKSTFSSQLIANNTRVSIFAMGLGITWGIGTALLLFTNGVMLGAVIADYVLAGESAFLVGWLLPHGSIEIPCIILAGQAGFVLAGALTNKGRSVSLKSRLRAVSGDLVVIMGGVAVLLVWAGFVEAFLSQYHEPVIPYAVKTGFGCVEMGLLCLFLIRGGKEKKENAA